MLLSQVMDLSTLTHKVEVFLSTFSIFLPTPSKLSASWATLISQTEESEFLPISLQYLLLLTRPDIISFACPQESLSIYCSFRESKVNSFSAVNISSTASVHFLDQFLPGSL
ncbi:hypothetical protein JTB14_004340 [Gonioctena quinquepunctata]|nr:hypothetical protein JTB14_004340 [Gonioctena quinquepunctata]